MQSANRRASENITHGVISKDSPSAPQDQLRKSPPTSFCEEPDHDLRPSAHTAKPRRDQILLGKFALVSKRITHAQPHRHPPLPTANEGSRVGGRVPATHLADRRCSRRVAATVVRTTFERAAWQRARFLSLN